MLSPLFVCCAMTILLLSGLGKLPTHCLIETGLLKSTKVNVIGDRMCWNLCDKKCTDLLQSNTQQYAECGSRWSYSDSNPCCDSNMKRGNEA